MRLCVLRTDVNIIHVVQLQELADAPVTSPRTDDLHLKDGSSSAKIDHGAPQDGADTAIKLDTTELTDAEIERIERENEARCEKMQFLRTSQDCEKPPETKKARNPAAEPPSAGCPSLATPSLDAYISDKEKDALFKAMARGLLEYVGCFPLARKVPIPKKEAGGKDEKPKTKEERDREARLKAKASANRKRDKDMEEKKKKLPPPPKTEKTALDFEYAMKRWLERGWKKGLPLVNTFRIGELMDADVGQLLKGSEPILESTLESVWNGYGFEVRSVPIADVSEWDWRDLALRLKNQHLIGDKFFPSEEYESQVGLDAMRVQEPRHVQDLPRKEQLAAEVAAAKRQTVLAREAVYWGKDADRWEDSTHVGLSADFSASTQLIRWDHDDAGPIVKHAKTSRGNNAQDLSRPSTSNTLAQFVETSNADWVKMRKREGGTEAAEMRRSRSEPLISSERKGKGMASKTATAFGKKKRDLSDEERQKQIEEEKAFRRFIKLHTGRTRVSQRKMEECREPFRLYKLQQKRIAAVGVYGGVLEEMEQDFQEMLDEAAEAEQGDDGHMDDQKKQQKELIDQLFPPQSTDDKDKENSDSGPVAILDPNFIPKPKEKAKEKPPPLPMAERLRVGSSMMTSIEASFANRQMTVGKTEVNDMLKTNVVAEVDVRDTNEVSFDEFLRRPMKMTLARDPGLVKSLRLYSAMVGETGLNEIDIDKHDPRAAEARSSVRRRLTKLPGLRANGGGGLPPRGREIVRSKSSLDRLPSDPQNHNINSLDLLVPAGPSLTSTMMLPVLGNIISLDLSRSRLLIPSPSTIHPNSSSLSSEAQASYLSRPPYAQVACPGAMGSYLREASNFLLLGLTSAAARTPRRYAEHLLRAKCS